MSSGVALVEMEGEGNTPEVKPGLERALIETNQRIVRRQLGEADQSEQTNHDPACRESAILAVKPANREQKQAENGKQIGAQTTGDVNEMGGGWVVRPTSAVTREEGRNDQSDGVHSQRQQSDPEPAIAPDPGQRETNKGQEKKLGRQEAEIIDGRRIRRLLRPKLAHELARMVISGMQGAGGHHGSDKPGITGNRQDRQPRTGTHDTHSCFGTRSIHTVSDHILAKQRIADRRNVRREVPMKKPARIAPGRLFSEARSDYSAATASAGAKRP